MAMNHRILRPSASGFTNLAAARAPAVGQVNIRDGLKSVEAQPKNPAAIK